MSANTILIICLLRKYSKFSTFGSQSAKISCPRIGFFGNPRKYRVREHFLSYSTWRCLTRVNKVSLFYLSPYVSRYLIFLFFLYAATANLKIRKRETLHFPPREQYRLRLINEQENKKRKNHFNVLTPTDILIYINLEVQCLFRQSFLNWNPFFSSRCLS